MIKTFALLLALSVLAACATETNTGGYGAMQTSAVGNKRTTSTPPDSPHSTRRISHSGGARL